MLLRPLRRLIPSPRHARPHFQPRLFSSSPIRQLFGLRIPEASNEPLAGTDGSGGPPLLFLLQVVIGLPTLLWIYKCLLLVAFQRRIIYLPSVPPGTRQESLKQDERTKERDSSLSGLEWKEVEIESSAPTRLLRRKVKLKGIELSWKEKEVIGNGALKGEKLRKVVVLYLQGNAGTPLMRIPLFRQLLRPDIVRSSSTLSPFAGPSTTNARPITATAPTGPYDLSILCVAPRSFWLSTRSTPTESSVLADYSSALEYAYRQHGPSAKYVLYGHSLGGAASVLLLDRYSIPPFSPSSDCSSLATHPTISGIVLENPLPSIPRMVASLYPQKWLPYHYLGFAAFDRWDAIGRLQTRAGRGGRRPIPSLWIRSGKDEIIPTGEEDDVRSMYKSWKAVEGDSGRDDNGISSKWVDVHGALHDTAYLERGWREGIQEFLGRVTSMDELGGVADDLNERKV